MILLRHVRHVLNLCFLLAACGLVPCMVPRCGAALLQDNIPLRSAALDRLTKSAQQEELERLRWEERRQRKLKEHYDSLRRDTAMLVELATGVKQSVESSNAWRLSPDLGGSVRRMENLAHQVRTGLRSNARHAKAASRSAALPANDDPRQKLVRLANWSLELAQQLKQSTDSYLEHNNQNMITVKGRQADGKTGDKKSLDPNIAEMLEAATELEGLSSELRRLM
jgi:hypothetical protein